MARMMENSRHGLSRPGTEAKPSDEFPILYYLLTTSKTSMPTSWNEIRNKKETLEADSTVELAADQCKDSQGSNLEGDRMEDLCSTTVNNTKELMTSNGGYQPNEHNENRLFIYPSSGTKENKEPFSSGGPA